LCDSLKIIPENSEFNFCKMLLAAGLEGRI